MLSPSRNLRNDRFVLFTQQKQELDSFHSPKETLRWFLHPFEVNNVEKHDRSSYRVWHNFFERPGWTASVIAAVTRLYSLLRLQRKKTQRVDVTWRGVNCVSLAPTLFLLAASCVLIQKVTQNMRLPYFFYSIASFFPLCFCFLS